VFYPGIWVQAHAQPGELGTALEVLRERRDAARLPGDAVVAAHGAAEATPLQARLVPGLGRWQALAPALAERAGAPA
jgi:hypothetical protein